jgi:hypothetical protein
VIRPWAKKVTQKKGNRLMCKVFLEATENRFGAGNYAIFMLVAAT